MCKNYGIVLRESFGPAVLRKLTTILQTLPVEFFLQGFLLGSLFHDKNGFALDVSA